MAATKNIIIELNKGLRFKGDNINICIKRILMVLFEQKLFNHIKNIMNTLSSGLTKQHKAFHDEWNVKNVEPCAKTLSTMDNDILCEFECEATAKGL